MKTNEISLSRLTEFIGKIVSVNRTLRREDTQTIIHSVKQASKQAGRQPASQSVSRLPATKVIVYTITHLKSLMYCLLRWCRCGRRLCRHHHRYCCCYCRCRVPFASRLQYDWSITSFVMCGMMRASDGTCRACFACIYRYGIAWNLCCAFNSVICDALLKMLVVGVCIWSSLY